MLIEKPGIKVRCDKHPSYSEMVQLMLADPPGHFRWYVRGCFVPGCGRLWDIWEGYFELVNGKPVSDRSKQHICPDDETAWYIRDFDPQGGVTTWDCAQLHCNRGKQEKPLAR